MDLDTPTLAAIKEYAAALKIKPAVLQAVVEIESDGVVSTIVEGQREPLIRFEGHYFYRRLKGDQRDYAVKIGLAASKAGKVKNPKSQAERWAMLTRATKIDATAAFESTSWGLGQVMGSHWKKLGYAAPSEMLAVVRSGVPGQIEVMTRYIREFGLDDELRRLDFTAFARGYNGPAFAKNAYHTKMALAYQRITGTKPVSAATDMLRMGSKGARVRELQALLVRDGYTLKVDGDYGTSTKDAVMAFQKKCKISVDGVVGPQTNQALSQLRVTPEEPVGEVPFKDVTQVKDAVKGMVPVTAIVACREEIMKAAEKLVGLNFEFAQTIGNYLLTGAGLMAVGLSIYGAYGYWKSKKTFEGDALT